MSKKSLHIAVFTDYYLPTLGGIQTSIKAQKEALEQLGHKVSVFCPGHLAGYDKTTIRLPTLKWFRPDGYPVAGTPNKVISYARLEVCRLKDIDIIHSHSDMAAGVAGLIVAKENGLPSVQTMHGREDVYAAKVLPLSVLSSAVITKLHSRYIPHNGTHIDARGAEAQSVTARRMWRLMISHANSANGVIVPSKHFAKKLQYHGVKKPINIVSNGIEETVTSKFRHIKPRSYNGTDALRIMWCGRVSPEKRPIEFLQSIMLCSKNIKVDMYGDGISMKKAKKFIKKHDLEDRVAAHGPVSQNTILREMVRHNVLVYSSFDFDNQPMVLLEAIATGLPVVYCDPELSEIIPTKGSILSDSPNPTAISDSINKIINNPGLIMNMSITMLKNREMAKQSRQTKKLISVYKEVIQNYQT